MAEAIDIMAYMYELSPPRPIPLFHSHKPDSMKHKHDLSSKLILLWIT